MMDDFCFGLKEMLNGTFSPNCDGMRLATICSKLTDMKTLAIILIVAGIAMIIIRGFSVQTEKKVLDVGPLEVNKTENKWIGWPTYAGGLVAIVGVVLLVSSNRKR